MSIVPLAAIGLQHYLTLAAVLFVCGLLTILTKRNAIGILMGDDEGKLVAVRTWDFGPFPPAWAEKIDRDYDQLWVHSRWVRDQAIAGGVHPRRVRVVPLGVETGVFQAHMHVELENDGPVTILVDSRRAF